MFRFLFTVGIILCCTLCCAAHLVAQPIPLQEWSHKFWDIPRLDLNQRLMVEQASPILGEHYLIEIETPGLLAIEAAVPVDENASPWIDLQPLHTVPPWIISRSLNRLVVMMAEPGLYLVRAGQVLPQVPASDLAITNRFLPWMPQDEGDLLTKDKDVEESDNEIFPQPAPVPPPEDPPTNPFRWPSPEVMMAEPEMAQLAWCDDDLSLSLWLCAQEVRLGEVTSGRVSTRDAEQPAVAFHVGETARIRVRAEAADVELFAGLYDETGHRIVTIAGTDGRLEVSPMLTPGRYLLRIEGMVTSSDTYRLRIDQDEP